MVIDKTFIIVLLAIGFGIIFIGIAFKSKPANSKKKKEYKRKIGTTEGVIERLNSNDFLQNAGSKFENTKLEVLFRKSRNPWNMTTATFNAIRYLGGGVLLLAGIILLFVDFTYSIILFGFAAFCYIYPKKKYQNIADEREAQWNKFYQFIWVIKHNLNYYDPKKSFMETGQYIRLHTDNLPELEQAFVDFANHWNGSYIDDYLVKTYNDFPIPKQLLEIVLNSQLTGEYPENELNSLRRVILEKMNFHVQEVLSMVGAKATMYSSPFLLISVALVVLVPVLLSIAEAFI